MTILIKWIHRGGGVMTAYLVYEIIDDECKWTGNPVGSYTKSSIAVFMNLKTAKEYISNNSNRYLYYEELETVKD